MSGNVLLLILNVGFIPAFVKMLRIPFSALMALVVVFCVMGSYTLGGSIFDIWTMVAFGVLGYVMKKLDFPQAPLVFAVVLGPLAEVTFRQALTMSQGSLSIFVASPIAAHPGGGRVSRPGRPAALGAAEENEGFGPGRQAVTARSRLRLIRNNPASF